MADFVARTKIEMRLAFALRLFRRVVVVMIVLWASASPAAFDGGDTERTFKWDFRSLRWRHAGSDG